MVLCENILKTGEGFRHRHLKDLHIHLLRGIVDNKMQVSLVVGMGIVAVSLTVPVLVCLCVAWTSSSR